MRKRRIGHVVLAAVISLVLGACGSALKGKTDEEALAVIQHEIPVGTSFDDARASLERLGAERTDVQHDREEWFINGYFDTRNILFLVSTCRQVILTFDPSRRLIRHYVGRMTAAP